LISISCSSEIVNSLFSLKFIPYYTAAMFVSEFHA